MKRGLGMIILTIAIVGAMWLQSPAYLYAKRPAVQTVTASAKDVYDSVLARGTVEETARKRIRLGHSAQIGKLYVDLGDRVTAGQLLCELSETEQKIPSAESVMNMLPPLPSTEEEAIAALSELSQVEDYTSLLTDWGARSEGDTTASFAPELAAPISGVITELSVKEGDIVPMQSVVATVSDFDKLQVRVCVPELYIGQIALGQKAEISGEAFSGITYTAKVAKISPTAKKKSSLTGAGETVVDVLLTINQKNTLLRPGYSVSAKIFTDIRKNAVVLPYSCVWQDEGEKEFVYVEEKGVVYRRAIRTGFELEDELEIRDGVKKGMRVVKNPAASLYHGAPVRIGEAK